MSVVHTGLTTLFVVVEICAKVCKDGYAERFHAKIIEMFTTNLLFGTINELITGVVVRKFKQNRYYHFTTVINSFNMLSIDSYLHIATYLESESHK